MNNWKPKLKNYPHFDLFLPEEKIIKIVTNPEAVKKNAFFPFLLYYEEKHTFGRETKEPRPIRYACRRDSYIFSYYRSLLSEKYEKRLKQEALSDHILAYRKIPVRSGSKAGKCNIHFAKEAFCEIQRQQECYAVALDISSYFESIDHNNLEKKWCDLMGCEKLGEDHKTVFKNVTNYSVVNYDKALEALGYRGEVEINGIKKKGYLPSKKDVKMQLCSPKDFRNKICGKLEGYADLVTTNKNDFGIPQGSPISDILANIYLLDFDKKMAQHSQKNAIYYRRYSDDLLFICPKNETLLHETLELAYQEIKKEGKQLEIKPTKTIISLFEKDKTLQKHTPYQHPDLIDQANKPFEYLGFAFDGKKIKLRDKTLSRFYQKMTMGIAAETNSLVRRYPDKTPEDILEMINISQICGKYGRVKEYSAVRNDYKSWTFWSYVKRADDILKDQNNIILKQMRNHKKKIKSLTRSKLYKAYFRHIDKTQKS